MMRRFALAVLVLLAPRAAAAQPLSAQPLSDDDRELIARGEISDGQAVAGGLVGTFFGFGFGHAIQGRYLEKGWIFTAGEAVSTVMIVEWLSECFHILGEDTCSDAQNGWLVGGLVLGLGFRVWELVDVWSGPSAHNARVRQARWRAGLGFDLGPAPGGGAAAGLTLRF